MKALPRRTAVIVFLAFAFAYFFSAVLRAVTATLAPTLTQEFALSARDLGLLAGGFFFGFAATQLPLGTWLDRYGPRNVILSFVLIAVAGCLAFALAGSFWSLLAARVLCGVGVSACLMAPLTGFRRWLEPPAQLRANSWMLMTGSLGMVASTLPVQWLIPVIGWRVVFVLLAAGLAIASLVLVWRVPGWDVGHSPDGTPPSYAQVWRHPYFRRLAPLGFFNYGGFIAIQSLWAGPWLVRVTGVDALQAAQGLFGINLAMLATFWVWGLLNPVLARRGLGTDRLIAWGVPLSLLVLAAIVLAGGGAGALAWAAFCMASSFVSLAQPAVGMAFPSALAGRALSAYNLVIFAGVFVVQWGIGLLVDAFGALGLPVAEAFRAAMAVFLACNCAAYAWFLAARRDNRPHAP
ncbi:MULTISPECIES: MFS transporter [Ramlibacter]|uniref:MFS transporter n=1 Tax=Ramlibacter pinisoli TaxID=2682844 RepID=A0A6N8IUP1_9BURK|nr:MULTISPECIES: MFS transporter [Ramlibacter]MBA2965601.1 MFS transporter [Ramlibacter sp. CGMCC 1.13660]MVQ30567.1 MFS transporter [Ramlibacter pinisoli]